MEPNTPKFRLQNQEKITEQQDQQLSTRATHKADQEFTSVEEMLRFDAARTIPPDRIIERLKDTLAKNPLPPPAWWRRIWPW